MSVSTRNFTIQLAGPWCRTTSTEGTLTGYGAYETTVTSTITSKEGNTTTKISTLMAEDTIYTIALRDTAASFSIEIPLPSSQGVYTGSGPVTASMLVRPVQLRWQSSDEALYLKQPSSTEGEDGDKDATTSTGTSSTSAATGTATQVVVGAGEGGLRGGAVASIVIGSVAGVVLLVVAGALIFRYRRRRLREGISQQDVGEVSGGWNEKPELAVPDEKGVLEVLVPQGTGRSELGGDVGRIEVGGDTGAWELGGARRVPGVHELDNTPSPYSGHPKSR